MVRPTIKIRFTGCPATSRRRFHLPYTFDQPDCTQAPRLHRLFLGGSSPACRPHFAHLGRSADRGGPGGRTIRSPQSRLRLGRTRRRGLAIVIRASAGDGATNPGGSTDSNRSVNFSKAFAAFANSLMVISSSIALYVGPLPNARYSSKDTFGMHPIPR